MTSSATLSLVISLCKSRVTELRLAACLWYVFFEFSYDQPHNEHGSAMQIIRAGLVHHQSSSEDSPALTVMYVVNRIIASQSDSAQTRTKACFILCKSCEFLNEECFVILDVSPLQLAL